MNPWEMTPMTGPKTLFLVPSLARAGAEKQVVDLVNGLGTVGLPCRLASFETNRDQLVRVDCDVTPYHGLVRRRKFDWGLVLELARFIDETETDILYCTLSIAVLYGFLARHLSKRKPELVSGVHTTLPRTTKDDILERFLYRSIYRSSRRVIFVCHRQKEFWLARDPHLARNSQVIYNGVDLDHFVRSSSMDAAAALRRDLNIPTNTPVFCCIAAFRPEKAQQNILLAMSDDRLGNSGVHGLFAGDGAERPRIESLAKELGLTDRVHFLGNIPDVRPVLAASNFSVISSTAVETFSFAMLESMSMGTPLVSSRIGGADEAVIPGRTGYLVAPGNVAELAKAMATMIGDPERTFRMGVESRSMVEKLFSLDTMVDQTRELLMDIHRAIAQRTTHS